MASDAELRTGSQGLSNAVSKGLSPAAQAVEAAQGLAQGGAEEPARDDGPDPARAVGRGTAGQAAARSERQEGVDRLARIAAEWFTFEGLRQALMTRGLPDPYVTCPDGGDVRAAVQRLLAPTRPEDEVERTYLALHHALGAHRELAVAPGGRGEATVVSPGAGALQALLRAGDDVFARWHEFQSDMQRIGVTLCQIRIDEEAVGTGFLVSDQHVLTAFHCVAPLVVDGQALPGSEARLMVTFDDVKMPGKARSACRTDVPVAPAWLAACSPPDDEEDRVISPLDQITPGCLDFALIRLAEPAGRQAPKLQTLPRKWLDLGDLAQTPKDQTQVLVAHHPGGADLRLSVGLFQDHCQAELRVRYLAPTVVGSSGAPCFSIQWKPYALHNAGYEGVPINQGVPLCLIREAIHRAGALDQSGPPLALIPPVTSEGEPVLGRQELSRQLELMLSGRSPVHALNLSSDERGGKRFTGRLLRAVLNDLGHPAFLLSMQKFSALTPESFARQLVEETRPGLPPSAMPPTPDSRQRARWVSRRLSEWVRQGMAPTDPVGGAAGGPVVGHAGGPVVGPAGGPAPYPAAGASAASSVASLWLIFEDCSQALLSTETQDLLLALLGLEDEPGALALRFAFLDYPGSFAALAPERVWQTRLALLSGPAVEPYMTHVLHSLGVEESEEAIAASAEQFVDAVQAAGIDDLPRLAAALKHWADTRRKRLGKAIGGRP